jgi:hypothetical protein
MVIQEGRLLGISEKYRFDFLEFLHNPYFITGDEATRQMLIAMHVLHHKAEKVPSPTIARFFNVTKRTVRQHWKRSLGEIFPNGRQGVFSEAIKSQMFHYIEEEFAQWQPV